MSTQKVSDKARELIGEDRLEEAIDSLLLSKITQPKNIHDGIISLKRRLSVLNDRTIRALDSPDELSRKRRIISNDLLALLRQLENTEPTNNKKTKHLGFILGIGGLILGIFWIAIFMVFSGQIFPATNTVNSNPSELPALVFLGLISSLLIIILFDFRNIFIKISRGVDILDDYSSRVRPIYLELHNYSFFHSPSGVKKPDNRFVGRKNLLAKLTDILTKSQTKAGAYLVSGYRGMGKTSLVRKVIAKVSGEEEPLTQFVVYGIRMIIIFLFLSIFNWQNNWSTGFKFGLFLIIYICAFRLMSNDKGRPNLITYYRESKKTSLSHLLLQEGLSFLRIFSIRRLLQKMSNIDYFCIYIIHISILFSLAQLNLSIASSLFPFSSAYLLQLATILLLWILGAIGITFIRSSINYYRSSNRSFDYFSKPYERLFKFFLNQLNSKQRIGIEISLAQDDIKEVDVLRILANRMLINYKKLTFPFYSINRFAWKFSSLAGIYFLSVLIFYFGPTFQSSYNFKYDIGMLSYFPSQGVNLLASEQNKFYEGILKLNTNDTIKRGESFHFEYREFLKDFYPPELKNKSLDFSSTKFEVLCIYTDYYILSRYLWFFSDEAPSNEGTPIVDSFPLDSKQYESFLGIFPIVPDYLFFSLFILLTLLLHLIAPYANYFGIINHPYILRRLRHLNDTIKAEITLNKQGSLGIERSGLFNFGIGTQKKIPIAGIRQIEEELIEILSLLNRIPAISLRPEFIFVFDELDKIQGNYNSGIAEKEASELSSFYDDDKLGLQTSNSVRRRKQAIERILSNLKRFFSVAQAKFIFIAGREMHDAALADASDRESFISSIFHEEIYVDSFYKDPDNRTLSDITGLTERYVCQFLIPFDSEYSKDLKGYNQYLSEKLICSPAHKKNQNTLEARKFGARNPLRLDFEKRKKVILALQSFITYLSYRSNGSPKKITKLMEEQVKSVSPAFLNDNGKALIAGKSSKNLYFHFDYFDQYRFGFTNYLFKPFLIAKGRQMRDLSDQMLVSTSFLMDHLFKFHNFGFSWRHLEQTPEIISVNKAPELRRFIAEIIVFLGDTHLEEIVSGLFQFKFTYLMANEISFISKVSELEAAAFNFTLDESLHLKRHYKRKVIEIRSQLNKSGLPPEKISFLNSLSLLNVYLGDLYFYDKEYEDAVLHYSEAKQSLRLYSKKEDINDLNLISIIRLNLRIGLSYEKMKDYESAFMAYGQITKTIRTYIFGQKSTQEEINTNGDRKFESIIELEEEFSFAEIKEILQGKKYPKQILLEFLRLIMQPLLARLHLIEKHSIDRLTQEDINRTINESNIIFHTINRREKFIILAEFYNKIGDLLFFKNGSIINSTSLIKLKDTCYDVFLKFNKKNKEKLRDYKAPIEALYFYNISIKVFIDALIHFDKRNKKAKTYEFDPSKTLIELVGFFKKDYVDILFTSKNKNLLLSIATSLSDMGDSLLSSLYLDVSAKAGLIDLGDLSNLFNPTFSNKENVGEDNGTYGMIPQFKKAKANSGNTVIYFFYLSGQFYKRASLYNKYAFQLRKILHFLRNLVYGDYTHSNKSNIFSNIGEEEKYNFLSLLREHIVKEALLISDRAGNFTSRQYLYEYERLMGLGPNHETSQEKLDLFTGSYLNVPDIKEMMILIEDIKIFFGKGRINLFNHFANPFTISNHKYVRLLELNHRANINEIIAREYNLISRLYDSAFLLYFEKLLNIFFQKPRLVISEKVIEENPLQLNDFERTAHLLINLLNSNRSKKLVDCLGLIQFYPSNPDEDSESEKNKTTIISLFSDLIKVRKRKTQLPQGLLSKLQSIREGKLFPILFDMEDKEETLQESLDSFWKGSFDPSSLESDYQLNIGNDLDENNIDISNIDLFRFLVSDSLFALAELIKTANIFGISYLINHTFMGNAHAEIADWSRYYHLIQRLEQKLWDEKDSKSSIRERLGRLVDEHDTHYFDIGYHYKKAEANYYLALEMHNEGSSYQDFVLNQMFFLDDDFNDDYYHFSAAIERYFINSGILRAKLNRVKSKSSKIDLFDFRYHFDFIEDENTPMFPEPKKG